MRIQVLATILELAGIGLLCAAAWLIEPVAGLAACGAGCLLVGAAIGREQ